MRIRIQSRMAATPLGRGEATGMERASEVAVSIVAAEVGVTLKSRNYLLWEATHWSFSSRWVALHLAVPSVKAACEDWERIFAFAPFYSLLKGLFVGIDPWLSTGLPRITTVPTRVALKILVHASPVMLKPAHNPSTHGLQYLVVSVQKKDCGVNFGHLTSSNGQISMIVSKCWKISLKAGKGIQDDLNDVHRNHSKGRKIEGMLFSCSHFKISFKTGHLLLGLDHPAVLQNLEAKGTSRLTTRNCQVGVINFLRFFIVNTVLSELLPPGWISPQLSPMASMHCVISALLSSTTANNRSSIYFAFLDEVVRHQMQWSWCHLSKLAQTWWSIRIMIEG